jgi:hypothetical protein
MNRRKVRVFDGRFSIGFGFCLQAGPMVQRGVRSWLG